MKKFFMVVGVYSCCVFVHDMIQIAAKEMVRKVKSKEEESKCETNACGFEVSSDSNEEYHQRLDRIGF